MLTVSAATRFKPTPPALVEIIKTNALFISASELRSPLATRPLKLLIAANRSSARTEPSRRSYEYFLNSKKSYISVKNTSDFSNTWNQPSGRMLPY